MRRLSADGLRWLGVVVLLVAGVGTVRGQVLAQKNWAGSGVTMEPWWRRAVFYRIDPAKFQDSKSQDSKFQDSKSQDSRFQDSKGVGRGDLEGIIQRLDYLQGLGVDALILESASREHPAKLAMAPEELDGLVRAAVGRHLRVLVELGAPASQQADAQYLGLARAWLNQGAAGLYVPTQALEKVDGVEHIALLLRQLRALTDSFPGERVLLADAPAEQDLVLAHALEKSTQLTASAPLGNATDGAVTAATLRAEWVAALGDGAGGGTGSAEAVPAAAVAGRWAGVTKASGKGSTGERRERAARSQGGGNPLLVAVRVGKMKDPAQRLAVERALAAMLLGSRAAVLLEYGQELGLDAAVGDAAPLMQWTPTNLTRKPPPKVEPPAPQPEKRSAYAGFQPFVRPLPRNFFPPPVMPVVVESFEPPPVDVALLPGFTAGELDASLAAPNGATANVALETAEAGSLLNLYKQLIELHHDNATVRSGSQVVLNRDAEDALVWVRRAPASSRTSATVVVGCNLSDKPVGLGEVAVGSLRSLLSPGVVDLSVVAPGAVVVGETR